MSTGLTSAQRFDFIRTVVAAGDLSASARLVAVALVGFANSRTGRCHPAYATLAQASGLRRRAAISAVRELLEAGWFEVRHGTGRSRTNEYAPILARVGTPPGGGREGGEKVHGDAPFQSSQSAEPEPVDAEWVQDDAPFEAERVHEGAPFSAKGCTDRHERVHGDAPELWKNSSPLRGEGGGGACARAPDGAAPSSIDLGMAFDAFWQSHPHAIRQVECRAEFERIVRDGAATAVELVDGGQRYAVSRAGADPARTLGSLRWLQDKRWTDRPATGERGGGGRQKVSLSRLALIHGGVIDGGER